MKVALFSARSYETDAYNRANVSLHDLHFIPERLTVRTAPAAKGCRAVCCFAGDVVDEAVLTVLKEGGAQLICLRSAGYNHVDLKAARRLGLPVVRVPDYSPYAVAEHATTLLLALNRKVHRAYNRVRELNFSLEGLVGFDLHGKTAGVVGAGRIGAAFANIMRGFGCRVLIYDPQTNPELANFATYMPLDQVLSESDFISLHVPLTPETRHLIDGRRISLMKPSAILINTGRGALVDTRALIAALKSKHLGGACLDVYEEEDGVFYRDLSGLGIDDDTLARLLTFPNVLVTAHQAFLTTEAIRNIATTTMSNITHFETGRDLMHRVA